MNRPWHEIRALIEERIRHSMTALKTADIDGVPALQTEIQALEWVLEQAKPPEPEPETVSDDHLYP